MVAVQHSALSCSSSRGRGTPHAAHVLQKELQLLARAGEELPRDQGEGIVAFFTHVGELTECMRVVEHAYVHHFFQKV